MAMMLLTAADVFSRYFLNRPIASALELTEALMAVTIFAALPLVSARGGHITVDLFEMLLGPRVSLYLDATVQFICAAAIGVLAWRMLERAFQLMSYGETSAVLRYPIWPTAAIIALGCAVSVLVFILRGAGQYQEARALKRAKPLEQEEIAQNG
jgi:TRAP-type C4-dicarboxylate transport system permease small subunit